MDKPLNVVDKRGDMAERSIEEAAELQELRQLLFRWRFEYVDDCMDRIDEHIRVLVALNGLSVDEVFAIHEAKEAILKTKKGGGKSPP